MASYNTKELKVTTIKDSLNDAIKALYVGKVFKGLEEDSHLENDANYQTVLNQIISKAEITLSFKDCYYEEDRPTTVLELSFDLPNKNYKKYRYSFEIELDTKFKVEDPE